MPRRPREPGTARCYGGHIDREYLEGRDRATDNAGSQPASRGTRPHRLLELQQKIGNRATAELLRVGRPKLDVGPSDDSFERQADAAARQFVNSAGMGAGQPDVTKLAEVDGSRPPGLGLARRAGAEVGLDGGPVSAEAEHAIESARASGGQPIEPGLRRRFEGAFGTELSDVRLHTGPGAAALNERVQARAFTVGNDIFLGKGAPGPTSRDGHELLAHEVTHTIQNKSDADGSAAPKEEVGRRVVRRKIDAGKVNLDKQLLNIKTDVHGVEVPKGKKVSPLTPLKDYPKDNQHNLSEELGKKPLLELQFPGLAGLDSDSLDFYKSAPASEITDALGGGAYNAALDLVVLEENFSDAALLHELGHKAQSEAGATNDTSLTVFLEYHNVLVNQNMPWYSAGDTKKAGMTGRTAPAEPRLYYNDRLKSNKGKKGVSTKEWQDFRTAITEAFDHKHAKVGDPGKKLQTEALVAGIEKVLDLAAYKATEPVSGVSYADIAKRNLITEYNEAKKG